MEQFLVCTNHPEVAEDLRYCSRCGKIFCADCLVDIQGSTFCAGCKSEQMLDLASGVNPTQLELADVGRRFVALLIDSFVIGLPVGAVIAVIMVLAVTNRNEEAIGFIMPFLFVPSILYIVYEGVMLSTRGQTLGKMAMKIRVVRRDGSTITTGQAWGRAVMRTILQGCLSIFNYLPAFFTKEKTCLHDLVSDTRVVTWS